VQPVQLVSGWYVLNMLNVSVIVSIYIAHKQADPPNVFSRRLKAALVEFGSADKVGKTVSGGPTNNAKAQRPYVLTR